MNINQFLSEHSYLVEYLTIFIYVIFSVLLFKKTGDIKYLKGVVEDMVKYRTENYRTAEKDEEQFSQKLSAVYPVYRLNKATGELEKTDDVVDFNDIVSSFEAQTLERIYQRFFPADDNTDVIELNSATDDLDKMQEAFALAEKYRSKYNLPDTLHFSEVLKEVGRRSSELKNKIELAEQVKKVVENEKKETVSQGE